MLFLLFNPQLVEQPPPQPALQQLQASGSVQLVRRGEQATMSMRVPVPPERAWTVLTNYARTFAAMPDVAAVQLVSRQGQKLRLQQVLQAPYTFGLRINVLLEGEENPQTRNLRYRLVRGDNIRALSGEWTLTPDAEGTLVRHTIQLTPEIPGLLQSSFRSLHDASLRQSFETLRQLMLAPALSDNRVPSNSVTTTTTPSPLSVKAKG
ncbi:SRPBCC family protein [Synechococcus sp. MU1655]|uniref:SRPBCC family protein n=1 Tax=Synechococcus sp. MU1655 TaxID=2508355 RepID=UPI00202648CA|nr:SRPBCC family protein [Synechococcus sp. MU1655]